jgi:hypothetical protein
MLSFTEACYQLIVASYPVHYLMNIRMRRDNKNSNMIVAATIANVTTVLRVGFLFLLILAVPPSSSSRFGLVEAVEGDAVDTEQIFSIQYSTNTMMEEEDDDNKNDGAAALLLCPGGAVAFMEFLPNEAYPVIKVFEDDDMLLSCAEQSICLVDSDSDLCTGIDMNINTTEEVITGGTLFINNEYDDDNNNNNEVYWREENGNEYNFGPDVCIQGGKQTFHYIYIYMRVNFCLFVFIRLTFYVYVLFCFCTAIYVLCLCAGWFPSCHFNYIPL